MCLTYVLDKHPHMHAIKYNASLRRQPRLIRGSRATPKNLFLESLHPRQHRRRNPLGDSDGHSDLPLLALVTAIQRQKSNAWGSIDHIHEELSKYRSGSGNPSTFIALMP